MEKVALIMCNNMHMDIENANKLLNAIHNSTGAKTETDYTKADTVIIITCAFGSGKQKSLQIIADVETNMQSRAKLILTGCMVKTNPELLHKVENAHVMEFLDVVKMYSQNNTKESNTCVKSFIPQNKVIISSGCLKKCSYCVYPCISNQYVSKPKEQVLEEVSRLYDSETTIYISGGLETSDYGIDLYNRKEYNISKLIKEICTKYPDCNYIIGWFHPAGLTDEFISVLKECKNIVEVMVHIQHVSNYLLKSMNRPSFIFTDERIRRIKKVREDLVISTEVIVGYPGETEEDFLQLVKYLDEGYFGDIGVASYERVAGTKAAELTQIPFETRMERMNFLLNRYKGSSSYPAPKVEEEQLESFYIQCKNIMLKCKGSILRPIARKQYNYVAGTDTSLKLDIQSTICNIYEVVLNARDELEISRVKKEINSLYTEEFREYLVKVFSSIITKPAIFRRVKYILVE